MARKRYGFAQTYSTEELDKIVNRLVDLRIGGPKDMDSFPLFEHERFHLFYTVPGFHNWAGLCRVCDATPLPRLLGGLVLSRLGSQSR